MKVKATKRGFYKSLREVDEEFDYQGPTKRAVVRDGKTVEVDYFPSWMVRLDAKDAKADAKKSDAKPDGKKGNKPDAPKGDAKDAKAETAKAGDGDQPPPPPPGG